MNNPSLLRVVPAPVPKGAPVHVSLAVDPQTAPYLVTSSKRVVWVDRPRPGDTVWAVFRSVSPDELFRELILSIVEKAQGEDWGCIFGTDQVDKACLRLCEYDLPETELLVSPEFSLEGLNIPAVLAPWLPTGHAVVVPINRDFLGTVVDLGEHGVAALIHNAARGISILVPRDEELVERRSAELSPINS